MRFSASRTIVTLALAVCIVCPVIEMFDHWDHTLQTGSETEYTFVILGLCIGVTYAFARAVLNVVGSSVSNTAASYSFLPTFFAAFLNPAANALIPASPPPTTLRI
jgi:MFS-type transporter involved in bile tolerance (Atg22 family)